MSRFFLTFLASAVCSANLLLAPLFDLQPNDLSFGAIFIIPFCALLVFLADLWLIKYIPATLIFVVRKMVAYALVVRFLALVLIAVLATNGFTSGYGVTDDETYHLFAMGHDVNIYEINIYHYILSFLYRLLSDHTLIGRSMNMVVSSVAIIPLAAIAGLILKERASVNRYLYLCVFSPWLVAWSVFEIKDIYSTFFLAVGVLLIIHSQAVKAKSWGRKLAPMILCSIVLEALRSSQGVLLFGVFIMSTLVIRYRASNKRHKALAFIVGVVVFIVTVIITLLKLEYFLAQGEKYALYSLWIQTQFEGSSLRSFFIVDEITDAWKIPLSFVFYLLSPLPNYFQTSRFMLDYGGWLKVFEQAFMILGIFGLPLLVRRVGLASIVVLVPLLTISVWNISNTRQGITYLPYIYLSAFLFLEHYPKYRKVILPLATALVSLGLVNYFLI